MPCYAPVTLYKSRMGPNRETGKWPLVSLRDGYKDRPQKVPCGYCDGCLLERSRQWAIRCVHESYTHKENSFLTLTYNDDELIHGYLMATLYPRHLQLFIKRLRKKYGNGIKYFACGEYGDNTKRPHYHVCLFGLDFTDKKYYSTSNGNNLYTSNNLDALWSHGNCIIGDMTFESAAYTARYIMDKKFGDDAKYYKEVGIEPEFIRMSRRPGIGYNFYKNCTSDIYPHDYCIIRGGIKTRPPKYYNGKYEIDNPIEMAAIKSNRLDEAAMGWRDNTPERLRVRERVKKAQIKSLTRKL